MYSSVALNPDACQITLVRIQGKHSIQKDYSLHTRRGCTKPPYTKYIGIFLGFYSLRADPERCRLARVVKPTPQRNSARLCLHALQTCSSTDKQTEQTDRQKLKDMTSCDLLDKHLSILPAGTWKAMDCMMSVITQGK